MEHKNPEEKPGPSGVSDLIIITPDELAKLGLFQDIQTTTVYPKPKKTTESKIESTNPKVKKQKVENQEAKIIVLNQANDNAKEENALTLKSKILGKPSSSLSEGFSTKPPQKVLNSEIKTVNEGNKIIGNVKGQTILNSKFLNKNLKAHQSSPILNKDENLAKLNRMTPPNNTPLLNPSKSQPKILNDDIKFQKRKYVIAQKKIDRRKHIQQTSGKKYVEKSTAPHTETDKNITAGVPKTFKTTGIANVKDVLTKTVNKEPKIINSTLSFTSIVDHTLSKSTLPSKNLTSLEETLRRGLNRILQKDIIKPPNIDELVSEPAIVIEDNKSDLDTLGIFNIPQNEKRASSGEIAKRNPFQKAKTLKVIEKADNPSVETINLEDSENPPKQIIPSNSKKEVNIISNTSLRLSNEELKHLVSKHKNNSQNNSPVKIPSRENTEHVIQSSFPVEFTVKSAKCTEIRKSNFAQNVSLNKEGIKADPPTTKIDVNEVERTHERADTLPTCSPTTENYATIEEDKKNYPATKETHISQLATQYSEKKSSAPVPINKKVVRSLKTPPKLLVHPKPISVTKADSEKRILENKEIKNVSEIVEQPESKLKQEEAGFKSKARNIKETDSNDGENTVQSALKPLHKSLDTNEAKNVLPSTSKLIDGPGLHDRQQQEGLKIIGKKLGGTHVSNELEDIRLKTKTNRKNLHTSADVVSKGKKNMNKNLSDPIINTKIEQEGSHNKSTISKKRKEILEENTVNRSEGMNRMCKDVHKMGSLEVIEGIKEETQLTKSEDKTIEKRVIPIESHEQQYEKKEKIKACKSSTTTKEDNKLASDKSEATEVNNSLEEIQVVPKKRGRLRNFNVEEKSRDSVAESKVDTMETAGDANKNESNVSKGYKADSNEKNFGESNAIKSERTNRKYVHKTGNSETIIDGIGEVAQLNECKDKAMKKLDIRVENKESIEPDKPYERKQKMEAYKNSTVTKEDNILEATDKSRATEVNNSLEEIGVVLKKRGRPRSLNVKEKSRNSVAESDTMEIAGDAHKNASNEKMLGESNANRNERTNRKYKYVYERSDSVTIIDGIGEDTQLTESKDKAMKKLDIRVENKESIEPFKPYERKQKIEVSKNSTIAKEDNILEATDKSRATEVNNSLEEIEVVPKKRGRPRSLNVKEKSRDSVAESKVDTKETAGDAHKSESNASKDYKADSNEKILENSANRSERTSRKSKNVYKTDSQTIKDGIRKDTQLTKSKDKAMKKLDIQVENKESIEPYKPYERKQKTELYKSSTRAKEDNILEATEVKSSLEEIEVVPKKRGRPRSLNVKEKSRDSVAESKVDTKETAGDAHKSESNISKDYKADSNEKIFENNANRSDRTNRKSKDVYKRDSETIKDGIGEGNLPTKSKDKAMKKLGIRTENKESMEPYKPYERKQKIEVYKSSTIAKEDNILEATDTSQATEVNNSLEEIEVVPKKRGRPKSFNVREKSRDSVAESKVDTKETAGYAHKSESNISKDYNADSNEKILENNANRSERTYQKSKDVYKRDSETNKDGIGEDTQLTKSKDKAMEKRDISVENKESIKPHRTYEKKQKIAACESSTIVKEVNILQANDKSEAIEINNSLEKIEAVSKKRGRPRKSTSFKVKEKSKNSVAEAKVDTEKTSSDVRRNKSNVSKDYKADSNETISEESNISRNGNMNRIYKDVYKMDDSATVTGGIVEDIQLIKYKDKTLEKHDIPIEEKESIKPHKTYGKKQKVEAYKSGTIAKEDNILEATDKSRATEVNNSLEEIEVVPKKRGRPRSFNVKEKSRDSEAADPNVDTTETSGDVHKNESKVSKNKADSNEKMEEESDLEPLNSSSLKEKDNIRENLKSNPISEVLLINESENSPIETIDTYVKPPRKRGRPKKVENLVEIREDDPMSLEENHEHMVTSTPLPNKRGRKRKSSVIAECSTEDLTEPVILDESRSGRKRKKVNYFQMNNSISSDEEEVSPKRRRRKTDTQAKDLVVKKESELKQYNKDSNKDNAQRTNEDKDIEETVNISVNNTECESGEDLKEKDESDVKPDCDDESKKQRKPRNKNTINLINSIFTAAVKNKFKNDSGAEGQELESPNIIVSTCDHRTRESLLPKFVIDEDNMVTCMTCKNKINNDEWDAHNRNAHYYLAWREGDPELNLADTTFLTKTLTPLMKEEKKLKCNKCGKDHTTVSSFITHMETCNGIVTKGDLVTCAVCKLEMKKNAWPFHKQRDHNNLAWRIGDRPLNLNDKDLVMNILNALYKSKKPLKCEKCGAKKKSVVGFLSHQSQCGRNIEEAQVKCELCDRKVLPVSMSSHIKMFHEKPKINDTEQEPNYFSVDSNATTSKRQAAKRAMLVIDRFSKEKIVQEYAKHFLQNVDFKEEHFVTQLLLKELADNNMIKCKFNNCIFQTEEVKFLVDHLDSCEHKPDRYFTCKKCLLICDTEEEIKKHIKEAYDIDIIDDDYKMDYDDGDVEEDDSDEEGELTFKELKKKMMSDKIKLEKCVTARIKHPHLYNVKDKKPGTIFTKAFKFTMEFCEQFLSQPLLFDHLRYWDTDWSTLPEDQVEEYLPKYLESCDVAWTKGDTFEEAVGNDYSFKKFEIFETVIDKGIATIYCGGPIHAMAWMPTPYTSLNSKQILAVAPGKCFEKQYLTSKWYNEPSVIQFWDFGVLKNNQEMTEPTMRFSLAVDFGPVWHLEWCPSGCYDSMEDNGPENKLARMGLLAVAGSDAGVYIYSIPFLYEDDVGSILKVKPSLKLFLAPRNSKGMHREEFYAVKISWSMGVGHKYIAVGYSDGLVGLFDISTNTSLVIDKDHDGVDILRPIKIFPAHYHYISVLHLLHNDDGKRWLLTGSFDRNVYFWDLSNDSRHSYSTTGKKFIVSDGVWLTNWLSNVITYDTSTTSCPVHATLRSFREHMCDRVNLSYSNTTVKSISSSNWLNSIVHGNTAGEIIATFPHSLYSIESEKHPKSYRYFFGCAKLINKHKSPEERLAEERKLQNILNVPKTKDNSESSSTEHATYNLWEPFTYNEGAAKYGVVFCDKKMDKISDFFTSDNKLKYEAESEFYKPQMYPMRAINKIAYNPNHQASLYYATGYQCGFVRLTYMKFWENDPHLK